MSFLLVLALMTFSCYVLHRWEQEEDRAPVPAPVPAQDIDDDLTDDDETEDDPTLDDEDEDEDEDDEADPWYGATLPDAGVDVEAIGWPWFDERSCWGCDRGCKRSKFHPYAGSNIGAEIRGASAARARARADEPYSSGDAPRTTGGQNGVRRSTSVDAMWDHQCEECGRLVRRVDAGLEAVPGSTVAVESGAEECPF